MSRKGNCWDNAPMESWFHTLKTELIHHAAYVTREAAKRDLFARILQPSTAPLRPRVSHPRTKAAFVARFQLGWLAAVASIIPPGRRLPAGWPSVNLSTTAGTF